LNKFCEKVAEISYLHYSAEYQVFLRQAGDFNKAIAPLQKFTSDDIISKYTVTFNHLSGKELNNDTVGKIVTFKLFLTKVSGMFENFIRICRAMVNAKHNYYSQFGILAGNILVDYEKNVLSEYMGNSDAKHIFTDPNNDMKDQLDQIKHAAINPSIEYVYEWIKQEAREIQALMEAIGQRERYEGLKAKV